MSSSDCEADFLALLVAAGDLRDQYETHLAKATANLRSKNLGRLDLPERLLVELTHTADLQYTATLVLLTNQAVAHATELNLRSLLEAVAQVAFVLGKDTRRPMGSVLQRSACLALARARQTEEMIAPAAKAKKTGKVNANRAAKIAITYQTFHDKESGCPWIADPRAWPCKKLRSHPCFPQEKRCRHQETWPCGYGKKQARPHQLVGVTIEGLERQWWPRKKSRRWLTDLYKVSSVMTHQSLFERLVRDTGKGLDIRTSTTYAQRGALLGEAVSLYAPLLGWVLTVQSPAEAAELQRWVQALYKLPAFTGSISGQLDKRCPD